MSPQYRVTYHALVFPFGIQRRRIVVEAATVDEARAAAAKADPAYVATITTPRRVTAGG